MTIKEVGDILAQIEYKDWQFITWRKGQAMYLMVTFLAPNPGGMQKTQQKGRKWALSKYMTKSEVVQTAFKAITTAEEHEARENFKYRHKAIFHPHYDVDTLVTISDNKDRRKS